MKAMLVEISETVDHLQFNNLETILLNPVDYIISWMIIYIH